MLTDVNWIIPKRKFAAKTCICFLMSIFTFLQSGYSAAFKAPETLDEKIDAAAGSISEYDSTRDYFIKLGPEVVPIVTRKLLQSLKEGASIDGSEQVALIDMPVTDRERVWRQMGLITMQGEALEKMTLDPEVKQAASESVFQALKSPYPLSREAAMYSAAYGLGSEAVDQIIPLLNDPVISNRYTAAKMLKKVGTASTADRIEQILEERRRGLTADQIEKDGSFRVGYEAVKLLRSGKNAHGLVP